MTNSADPDQLASSEAKYLDLHCLQRQGISGFSRIRVNSTLYSKSFDRSLSEKELMVYTGKIQICLCICTVCSSFSLALTFCTLTAKCQQTAY